MRNIIRFDLSLAPIYNTEQFVFGILNALFEFKNIYVVFVIINPGSLNKKILNLEIVYSFFADNKASPTPQTFCFSESVFILIPTLNFASCAEISR